MFGDNVKISENLILVEGMIPRSILIEPDIANAVVYKKGDTVYLIDTGATLKMRGAILKAIESLKPFRRFVLLNSHGHPDHTANNGIINHVDAEEKKHLISRPGIPMMDFENYFKEKYAEVSKYCSFLDGPRFPISIGAKVIKLLGRVDSRFNFLMVEKSINKFKPFDTSVQTAKAFEDDQVQNLGGILDGWTGWCINDFIWALETRGHSPDHISFYIPDEKALILADETFLFFNCWPDSNSENIEKTLELSIAMYSRGDVEILITGHEHEVFSGSAIEAHLSTLLDDYRTFRTMVLEVVREHPEGITVNRIYSVLRSKRSRPVLKKYFAMEFPKMPPMLKTVITSLLLSEGCEAVGPEGRAVFTINEVRRKQNAI